MFDKVLFIGCLKMSLYCLTCYWFHYLRCYLWFLRYFESFVCPLVCCFCFKNLWTILSQAQSTLSTYLFNHLIMFTQLLLLLFCKILSIVGFTLERQRIEWILWLFFMENIILTILPIRKCLHVRRVCKYWFTLIHMPFRFFLFWNYFEFCKCFSGRCLQIHLMRIYYF